MKVHSREPAAVDGHRWGCSREIEKGARSTNRLTEIDCPVCLGDELTAALDRVNDVTRRMVELGLREEVERIAPPRAAPASRR